MSYPLQRSLYRQRSQDPARTARAISMWLDHTPQDVIGRRLGLSKDRVAFVLRAHFGDRYALLAHMREGRRDVLARLDAPASPVATEAA